MHSHLRGVYFYMVNDTFHLSVKTLNSVFFSRLVSKNFATMKITHHVKSRRDRSERSRQAMLGRHDANGENAVLRK